MPHDYNSLVEAINGLKESGYTMDFNLKENCIHCGALGLDIVPDDFQIDKMIRFEGMTNPADSSIVYAISSKKHDIKGVMVDAYGVYSTTVNREMLEKLRWRPDRS